MSNVLISDWLNQLKTEVEQLQRVIYAYEVTDMGRYPMNFESLGMDMVLKAEAIACSVRNIVCKYPSCTRERMLAKAIDAQGIEVFKTSLGYEILIPGLMPKRNRRNNCKFLLEPLSYALKEFFKNHTVERLEKALVWYVYEYDENMSARHIRDYDNLEAKEVLDVVNTFFLIDDSGEFCELHYSTKRGEKNCTHIIISPEVGLFSYPETEVI